MSLTQVRKYVFVIFVTMIVDEVDVVDYEPGDGNVLISSFFHLSETGAHMQKEYTGLCCADRKS